jgi:hypothetical protein
MNFRLHIKEGRARNVVFSDTIPHTFGREYKGEDSWYCCCCCRSLAAVPPSPPPPITAGLGIRAFALLLFALFGSYKKSNLLFKQSKRSNRSLKRAKDPIIHFLKKRAIRSKAQRVNAQPCIIVSWSI